MLRKKKNLQRILKRYQHGAVTPHAKEFKMNHILFNNNLFLVNESHKGFVTRGELFNKLNHSKNTVIALIDCECERIAAPSNNLIKDKLMSDEFTAKYGLGYSLQSKLVGENLYHVFGAKEKLISEIYGILKNDKVKILPYALVIGNLLSGMGYIKKGKTTIFVDVIGEELLITFFEHNRIYKTRHLQYKNLETFTSELERSRKDYFSTKETYDNNSFEEGYLFVTNDENILNAVIKQNVTEEENCKYIDNEFCFHDGLVNIDTDVCFRLQEVLLREKKAIEYRLMRKRLFLATTIAMSAFSLFMASILLRSGANNALNKTLLVEKSLNNKLRNNYRIKLYTLLEKPLSNNYGFVFHNIVEQLPNNYIVEDFNISNVKKLGYQVDLFLHVLNSNTEYNNVDILLSNGKVLINDVFIKDLPGKHIMAKIVGNK